METKAESNAHPESEAAARARRAQGAHRARGLLASVAPGRIVSDELIAERRAEARRERRGVAAHGA